MGRHLRHEGHMPSLDGATAWLNSSPVTTEGLRGRVVVVDFWTYTCINWLRTLPFVRAWANEYEADGLVVIGVHTPEFGIEHEVESVRRAAQEMNIEYPIAIDNEYAVWEAFANHYWPALYFVDARGEIRHHHFGEGEYEQSELMIQDLLEDAGAEVHATTAPLQTRTASRSKRPGTTSPRLRPTSATGAASSSHRRAACHTTNVRSTRCPRGCSGTNGRSAGIGRSARSRPSHTSRTRRSCTASTLGTCT